MQTQTDLHDMEALIVTTNVCKLIVSKVDRFKRKGQPKSKFPIKEDSYERRPLGIEAMAGGADPCMQPVGGVF